MVCDTCRTIIGDLWSAFVPGEPTLSPTALLTVATCTSAVGMGRHFVLIGNDTVLPVSEEHQVPKVLATSVVDRDSSGNTVR